jgi:ribonuclease HI
VTYAGRRAHSAAPLVLYFDGASRGNPGPSAYGVWSPTGLEEARVIGTTTNNVAEWRGFLAALDLAVASGAEDVEIRADSQLVLRQFSGEYRMKAPHLAEYLVQARARARKVRRLRVLHVPRAENREADALANRALDTDTRHTRGAGTPA